MTPLDLNQQQLLINVLANILFESGLITRDVPGLSGPQLLQFGEEYVEYLKTASGVLTHVATLVEAPEAFRDKEGACLTSHDLKTLATWPAGTKLYTGTPKLQITEEHASFFMDEYIKPSKTPGVSYLDRTREVLELTMRKIV